MTGLSYTGEHGMRKSSRGIFKVMRADSVGDCNEIPEINPAKFAVNSEGFLPEPTPSLVSAACATTVSSKKSSGARNQPLSVASVDMYIPKRGRSARWGAACAPCAAAKTRCIRTQTSEPQQCDRCQSLEKECIGQISVPRKKRQVKSS
jgi:hypothetical protein